MKRRDGYQGPLVVWECRSCVGRALLSSGIRPWGVMPNAPDREWDDVELRRRAENPGALVASWGTVDFHERPGATVERALNDPIDELAVTVTCRRCNGRHRLTRDRLARTWAAAVLDGKGTRDTVRAVL